MTSNVPPRFLTLLASYFVLSFHANAQDLSSWAKVISFRPETKVQETLQARPADAAGARYKTLHIERARGNLFLQSIALPITKLPAGDGKAMTMGALLRKVRGSMDEMMDDTKLKITFPSPEEKAQWATDKGDAPLTTFSSVASGVDYSFMLGEATSEHVILTTVASSAVSAEKLVSGLVWIGVSSASPLDGCVLRVQTAFRPTQAATHDDEWKVAEAFGAVWIEFVDRVRAFVQSNSGASLPELTPPTMAYLPWTSVAKNFHTPTVAWAGVEGTWRSTEREQRFRIEFHGDSSCDLIERSNKGKELRITLSVITDPKEGYIIERPNDRDEVLEFYDFQPGTREAILERKPEPSRLVLKRNSKGRLVGNWYGFSISRDAGGNLTEIKQPSKMSPKMFEFVQALE